MPGNLLHKNTIAGAVAREIVRGGRDGIAYKAEFERRGADSIELCNDAARDAQLMTELAARRLEA
jgi:hypothetical protein